MLDSTINETLIHLNLNVPMSKVLITFNRQGNSTELVSCRAGTEYRVVTTVLELNIFSTSSFI